MPNLPVHVELAYQTAKRINHPTLDTNVGLFLLGSTSPDIRIITRYNREKYHFTSLDFQKVGDGVEQMLNTHSDLAKPDMLNHSTQAFIAGYIAHLITDEIWIIDVFRPYFANKKIFSDDIFGKVMDRARLFEWLLKNECAPFRYHPSELNLSGLVTRNMYP